MSTKNKHLIEEMLEACLSDGHFCDPEQVARDVRAWFINTRAEIVPSGPDDDAGAIKSKKDLEALSKSKRALDALRFARSELVEWAKYVPEDFLEKHDFADTLARLDRAFDAAKPNTILIMPLEQAPEEILWERMSIMPIDLGFCLQTQGMSFSVDLSQDPLTVTYPSEDGDPLVIYGLQHKVLAHLKRLGYPSIVTKEPATRFNPPL